MNSSRLDRRHWLQAAAGSLAGTCLATRWAQAIDYAKPVPEAEKLTAYLNGSQVLIRWNNRLLTGYRAHASLKYPYFNPLAGPASGLSVTAESALPYPHHRGLWLGCDPLNGGNYWSDGPLKQGQIKSTKLELTEATKESAQIQNECQWIRPEAPSPLKDQRQFTVRVLGEHAWVIDADITLSAQEDISIKRAKHSLFAIRAASDISPSYGGVLMNSKGGVGAEGTYGKPANWCGYHGKRASQPDVVEGIAVMDHPENPWGPCPWFTREYGHLSPSPFNFLDKPWQFEKGNRLRLRYRVVVHAGTPAEAGLNKIYQQWIDG